MRWMIPAAACLAVLLAVPARGAETVIENIEIGFAGHYKAGEWTPLQIHLSSEISPEGAYLVETETIDADGSTVSRTSPPVTPQTIDNENWLRSVFQAGRLGSGLTIRIRATDGEILAEERFRAGTDELPTALTDDVPLWITGVPLPERDPDDEASWSADLRIVSLSAPLPVDAMAYQSVDLLIVPGDLEASDQAFEAIRRFVAGGGRLAISLGERTTAFENGPLAEWVPAKTAGTIQLREFSDVENYAKSKQRLPARARIRIAAIESTREPVVGWSGGILVARDPYAFGDVTLFAFDFAHVNFSNWTGLPAFIERAIRRPHERLNPARSSANVSDLATQLVRAQDRFPGISRASVGQVLLLLLVYAVIVGPLDYLLVHRWLGRPALTWITLPLIVAGAAWWLNSHAISANGTQSRYNELTLLDHDLASGVSRGRSIVTLYAAQATRTDLAVDPSQFNQAIGASGTSDSTRARLGWLAAPEETFGGLYRDAAGGLFRPQYAITASGQMAGASEIPLLAWSSRQFKTNWQTKSEDIAVTAELTGAGHGFLEGTLEHSFATPIRDWMIVFGGQAYLPRDLEWQPDTPLTINTRTFSRRDLRSLLTGQTQISIDRDSGEAGAEYFVTETAYDQRGIDIQTIARMLSFHESAGGRTYTKLSNSYFSTDDLTPLLNLGRAVLWGEIEPEGSAVTISGESGEIFEPARRRTFIRIILPVQPAASEPAKPLVGEEE